MRFGLLCDLAFCAIWPLCSLEYPLPGERLKGEELPKDNSLSARVSTSSGTMGSFPLLRVIERTARQLFGTYFPR